MFETHQVTWEEAEAAVGDKYVVATYGWWYGGRVEVFSSTQDGPDEIVCIYEDANETERKAALARGRKKDIPVLVIGR